MLPCNAKHALLLSCIGSHLMQADLPLRLSKQALQRLRLSTVAHSIWRATGPLCFPGQLFLSAGHPEAVQVSSSGLCETPRKSALGSHVHSNILYDRQARAWNVSWRSSSRSVAKSAKHGLLKFSQRLVPSRTIIRGTAVKVVYRMVADHSALDGCRHLRTMIPSSIMNGYVSCQKAISDPGSSYTMCAPLHQLVLSSPIRHQLLPFSWNMA